MKNQLTQLNILGLSPNVITKIFTLIGDKDLLRFREICHAAKDKVDASILNKCEDDVKLFFSTYFDVLGSRSYTFLRIAITKIRTELPIITINAHEDRIFDLRFTLKLADVNTFLDLLRPRISGVQWRRFCLYEATPDIVRSCADFFNGMHVNEIHTSPTIVGNAYSPWLTLIRNVSPAEFSCSLSVITKDDYKFLIELSENVYCASIIFGETNISLLSIAKAMFSRKCVDLDFAHNFFTHSDLESLITFFNRLEKKVSFNAFTHAKPLDVNVGAYNLDIYEWEPASPEGKRSVYIMPIEYREQE